MCRFWAAPRTPHPATSGHFSNRAIKSRPGPIAHGGRTIPVQARGITVTFTAYSSGWVCVGGVACDHDLIIDRGKFRKRKKAASREGTSEAFQERRPRANYRSIGRSGRRLTGLCVAASRSTVGPDDLSACGRRSMSSATFTHSSRMRGRRVSDVDRFVDRVAG